MKWRNGNESGPGAAGKRSIGFSPSLHGQTGTGQDMEAGSMEVVPA